MSQFLVFQLYAPLASWGEEAPGEMRPTSAVPTRSALLGLLAAALGICRDEEQRLNAFHQHYHLAVHPLSGRERWLRDYHTVSAPRENRRYRYHTRRDELTLAPEEVGTIVTQRDYRCESYWHIAVSAKPEAEVTLETLRDALLAPHFPLYLGRKSCPLALPLAPRLIEGSLSDVLLRAQQEMVIDIDKEWLPHEFIMLTKGAGTCYWDDPQEASLACREQRRGRYQPLSRQRWQFTDCLQFSGPLQGGE